MAPLFAARHGRAWRGAARRGTARRGSGKSWPGSVWQGMAGLPYSRFGPAVLGGARSGAARQGVDGMAGLGGVWPGPARQGSPTLGRDRQGEVRPDVARLGAARPGLAGPGWAGQGYMSRRPLAVVAAALAAVGATIEQAVAGDQDQRTVGFGQIEFRRHGPEWWAARWRREHKVVVELHRRLRRQHYQLLQRGDVVEAINLAAATYGDSGTLWRRARCETGGTFDPEARNGSSGAAGLFQFMPSTWRSTPYAVFSVWSPYANALAAGWMNAHGRGGEWACR